MPTDAITDAELADIERRATAATCGVPSTSTASIEDVVRVMREFRAKHPLSEMLRNVSMNERELRRLLAQVEFMHTPVKCPRTIEGVPVWLVDGIPDGCYDMEYADGHVDRVTPAGQFRIKDADVSEGDGTPKKSQ